MANEHPFQHLFETLGRTPPAHADSVNRQAYQILSDILTVPLEKTGRCILLRASRAGHGKTHLLSRIQHQLGANHEFIPLHAAFGCRIDAGSVIDDTLRCLVRQLPASGGLCVLDLVTRRLFASALQPLVASGEVPCQDREGALTALRMRPIETFDFHHPNAVTAHWARENFEVLGQRLSLELAQRADLPVREVAFWVEALFRFASAPLDVSNRVSILAEAVHQGAGGEMERLEALLGLVTQLMRVVLVADDLEGFSSDETAALRFGAFLGALRQSVDRLDVILSLNLDIWESAFVPRLSGGLADRLSEVVVELEPLKEAEMAALLDSRVPGLGAKVLERIDLGTSGRHARGLIRAAGMAWLKATAMDTASAAETPPVTVLPVPEVAPPRPMMVTSPAPEPTIEPYFPAETVSESAGPAVTFVEEIAPIAEAQPVWPLPEFSPPPPLEMEPETPTVPILDSGFTPSANFEPEPAVENSFEPPAASWSPAPQEFQPSVASPFFAAPTNEPQEPLIPQVEFQPSQQSPFQAAYSGETFHPPVETQPINSPFQMSPSQPALAETVTQEASFPQATHQPHGDAPAQAFDSVESVPSVQPAPEPAASFAPVEEIPPPSPADTDRVDDLLRQFRERYGRGSL